VHVVEDEKAADWSLLAYYWLGLETDEARTMRHALMTKLGTEKSIKVYLGQGADMVLDMYS